jgi:hypothetical protein
MTALTEAHARALIDAHFERRISPSNERVMRAHLASCDACGEYYESHLLLERVTRGSEGTRERVAAGLGLTLPAERTNRAWILSTAFAAAAAVALTVGRSETVRHAPGDVHAEEFAARGGDADATPHVLVYKMNPTREIEPGGRLKASDELAFAYTNPGGFGHLLVFGVDEHRHVYWYHPAWTNHIEHPRAIAIDRGPAARELPEAIRHDIDGQALTLYALFLDEDLPVERIEELVGETASAGDALPLPAAYQARIPLAVER